MDQKRPPRLASTHARISFPKPSKKAETKVIAGSGQSIEFNDEWVLLDEVLSALRRAEAFYGKLFVSKDGQADPRRRVAIRIPGRKISMHVEADARQSSLSFQSAGDPLAMVDELKQKEEIIAANAVSVFDANDRLRRAQELGAIPGELMQATYSEVACPAALKELIEARRPCSASIEFHAANEVFVLPDEPLRQKEFPFKATRILEECRVEEIHVRGSAIKISYRESQSEERGGFLVRPRQAWLEIENSLDLGILGSYGAYRMGRFNCEVQQIFRSGREEVFRLIRLPLNEMIDWLSQNPVDEALRSSPRPGSSGANLKLFPDLGDK